MVRHNINPTKYIHNIQTIWGKRKKSIVHLRAWYHDTCFKNTYAQEYPIHRICLAMVENSEPSNHQ